MTQGPRNVVRSLAAVLGTLTACTWLPLPAAHGSCGHYVIVTGAQDDAPAAQHPSQPARSALPAPHDDHKPCSGPRCSGTPPASPAPPAPPAPVFPKDCGLPAIGVSLLDAAAAASWHEDQHLQPIQRGSDVFHPPRSA